MTSHEWTRVKDALAELCEADPLERKRRLALLEGEDADLAQRVRHLLDQEAEADAAGFLLPVTEDPGRYVPELAALPEGARVGPFQIERVHAVGGASIVYAARQASPNRRVALKVLVPGPHRAEALVRFEVEKDLLARLAHPGIAEIYGAATAEEARLGEPWIAMEWVEESLPIVAYARQFALDQRARLRLFLEVCAAVQHGHVRGVVHRDLKPANVLVDREGRAKVIDFGIARVLDETSADTVTRHGDFLGTLAYMSPEQLDGDAHAMDTRGDVFALGVMLFELLCDQLPYQLAGDSITGAVRRVRETAPRRPSKLVPEVGRDLEAVVLAALARDPAKRYSNAGELGADLQRVLERRPVVARPPGALESMWLLLRRHRVAATAAAGLVLAVTLAVGGAFWLVLETSRIEASERKKLEVTTEYLSALLMTAAPGSHEGGVFPREMLAHVSATLDDELPDEARADLHLTLGATWLELADYDQAVEHLDLAYAMQRRVHGPNAKWAPCALDMKGEALIRAGRPRDALAVLEQAYQQYRRDPQHPRFMSALAAHKRAKAHRDLGELAQAEQLAREALQVYRQAFGDEAEMTLAARATLDEVVGLRGGS